MWRILGDGHTECGLRRDASVMKVLLVEDSKFLRVATERRSEERRVGERV